MAPKKFFVLTLKSNVPKASPEELEKQCGDVVVEGIREVFAAAVAAKQSHAVSDLSYVADPVRRGELAIHRCLPQTFSFHTVFESGKDWYHLATARMLQRVQDCLNTQIPLTVDAFLRSCVHPDTPTEVVVTHSEALSAIASVWNFVVASLRLISHLLSHFDNAYCRTHVNNAGVEGLGVAMLIRDVRNPFEPVFRAATTGFLEAVAEDREGNAVSRGEMASFRVLAVAMNRFHPDIELAVKTQADAHFTRLGNLMVYQDRLTIEQFTQRCEAELAAERHRVAAYGHTSTRSVIEAIVQERLIKPHVAYMANQGLKGLVQNRSYSTVTSLYRLARLESVKQEEAIKRAFREYVGKTAAELVGAQDMEDTLIDMLIAHNKTCSEFVASCFTGVAADSFGIAKKEAFEGAIRPKQNKCAELLAKYLDGYLRGNGGSDGGVCEAEQIDQALTSAMELFDFIPSKDVFEAFYAKDFGKRLILQRSVGVEHERIVIDKLRLVCGPSIAVKLNGMMKDIDVSRELTNLFKQTRYVRPTPTANNGENGRSPGVKHSDPAATTSTLSDTQNSNNTMDRTYSELGPAQPSLMGFDLDAPPLPRDDSSPCLPVASPASTDTENSANGGSANVSMANCGFDFNPTVLTHGYWPSYPDFSPQLPSNVSRQMELFKIFYCSKHSSRKLSWQFSLSHCVLRAVFPKTKKELVVSFLQAIMLLQFNNEDSLTYGELLARLGIQPCEEATCAIIGLYAGNAKLLLREKAEGLPPLPPPKKGEPRTVVRAEDRIQYNAAFTHRLTKIRVNQVQLKETKEETQETTEKVLAERHYVVDAAIVRFMKSRKQSNHNELVSEVVGMLRFAAQPSDIKKRIEVLIERDYLERDSRDPSLYRYLA